MTVIKKKPTAKRKTFDPSQGTNETVHRFIGLSLSGGNADKACLAVIEFFPDQNRIFLSRMYENIKNEDNYSADQKIVHLAHQYSRHLNCFVFDVPISLPKCIECVLKCPGFETCKVKEVTYSRDILKKINADKKPKRGFSPYTQRAIDTYLTHQLEERFEVHQALSANLAPLTARALFLQKRIKGRIFETNVKISVARLGDQLKIPKSHSRFHRHSQGGDESRHTILQQILKHENVFVYHQDLKSMIDNNHAFEAFIAAFMGFLNFQKKTSKRPQTLPKSEPWPLLPEMRHSAL